MSRIPTPATIEAAPAASQPLLQAVKKQLGVAPNLFRLVANSPRGAGRLLGLSGALAKGELPAATRERIALAVAEINGCDYCLSAHTYLGRNVAQARRRRDRGEPPGHVERPQGGRGRAFRGSGRPASRARQRRGLRGGQGGGLHRRAGHRDRPACGAQYLDELHQHGRRDGNRLSRRHGPARRPEARVESVRGRRQRAAGSGCRPAG